jgi:CubicO group peptidase (beta-lactamase class C family)
VAFRLILILLLAWLMPIGASAQSAAKLQKIDTLWRQALEKNRVRHAALVVSYRGKVIHTIEHGRKATERAAVASVTKSVTAACIARLVDQGKLQTGTTLGEVFGTNLSGLGLNNPGNASITIAQLLTHSSGLKPDHTRNGGIKSWYGRSRNMDHEIAVKALAGRRGGKAGIFFYSNENYAILGEVVRARTGQPPEKACVSLALAPAGISGATSDGYWGAFGSAAGWSLSAMDLMKFASRNYSRNATLGRPVASWPRIAQASNIFYGMGEQFRVSSRGHVSYHMHLGHLNNGQGRNDGAFFVVLGNGWVITATSDTMQSKTLNAVAETLQQAADGPE